MALKDLLHSAPPPTPAGERPPGITCEKYTRGEGKRCVHYASNGACLRDDEFMCVEWLKANGPKPTHALPVVVEPPKPDARDLFGNPLPEVATPPPTQKPSAPPASIAKAATDAQPTVDVDQLRGFTTEDIESFKALGVEVLLHSETYGDVWLVPSYTGQGRKELTPEHAATIARVLSVFPGSHVIAFEKTKPTTTNPERRERPVEERS